MLHGRTVVSQLVSYMNIKGGERKRVTRTSWEVDEGGGSMRKLWDWIKAETLLLHGWVQGS